MNKKMMTAAVLSLALTIPMASQAFAAATTFNDIEKSAAKSQIVSLQERGIINGVSATSFKPEAELTVSQGISLIVKSMNLSLAAIDFDKAPVASGVFSKVKDNAWYANELLIAHFNGIKLDADIDPNAPLTREAFINYLVQGIEKTGDYALIKMYINIEDEKDIDPNFQGTIQRALLYKVTELDEQGNFHPKQIVTREEAAAILFNAVSFVEEHLKIQEGAAEAPTDSSAVQ